MNGVLTLHNSNMRFLAYSFRAVHVNKQKETAQLKAFSTFKFSISFVRGKSVEAQLESLYFL